MSGALASIWSSLFNPFRALVHHVRELVQMVHAHARQAWERHTDRLDVDRSYRRTLVTAITALATTMVPHPVIAAALGVWITETPRPPLRPVDYDPDDDDDHPSWRARPTAWDPYGQ